MRPFLLAIRDDGTVLGIAENYDIPQYENNQYIGSVTVPYDHVLSMCFAMNEICMLRDDGTVYVLSETDYETWDELRAWTGVTQLAGGINGQFGAEGLPLGIRADGTLLSAGSIAEEVKTWGPVEKVYAGASYLIGIGSNGEVYSYPANTDFDGWDNISEIIPSDSGWHWGTEHFVGLNKDGTVVAAGDNTFGQCLVS